MKSKTKASTNSGRGKSKETQPTHKFPAPKSDPKKILKKAKTAKTKTEDNSERKRAEEVLRENDERLSKIFSASPIAISIARVADGKLTEVNDVWCKLMGFSREEAVGYNVEELKIIDEEQRYKIREEFIRSKGSIRLLDSEITTKSGEKKSILTSTELITIKGVPFSINSVIDITERKQAEESLQKSNIFLESIIEQSTNAIWISDENGTLVRINQACCDLLNLTAEEVAGKYNVLKDNIVEEQGHMPLVKAVFEEGKSARFELRYDTSQLKHLSLKGMAFVILDVNIFPIRGANGKVTNAVIQHVDITERKRSEEEVRYHLNQLTALNKASLQLQKLHSPQILAREIIKSLEVNLHYTYGAALLIEESCKRLIPFALSTQNQDASFEEQDKKYVESKGIRVGKGITGWVAQSGQNVRLGDVRQDARYFSIRDDIRSELCVPLKAGDQVIGVINIESLEVDAYSESDERVLETIAAQVSIAIQNARLFEQVQRQTAELEQRVLERTAQLKYANKELESFSYSVSHDLRAPLRAISGFAEIIARRHRASLNEEGQHYFDNIIQASERMGYLIDDLLNFSRLGRAVLRQEPVSLSDMLADIARDFKGKLDELHGTIRIAEDLPNVTGDNTLLSQVFTNLLDNAIKYHLPDVTPQVTVDFQVEDHHVVVSVNDNGIGIPLEYQDKIFAIFQRLHAEEEYPGTGIGLATVKKSVELLGGEVWVESQIGKGSTFFVKL